MSSGASPLLDGMERYAKQLRSSAAPASASTVRRRSVSPLAARPSINAWNTRCMRLRLVLHKHSSSARWREAMIREGCFHRGPRRGRFALEAFTQITQRTNAPAVARPARWPAFGRTSSRVLPRPARPLRPPPFGRTRILAILCRAGKVSPVGLLPQSGHKHDTRHCGDDNCGKSQTE